MAHTAPTVQSIKDRFPEFRDVATDRIKPIIDEAGRLVDTSWREADYAPAMRFLVAHILLMEGVLQPSLASQFGPAAMQGVVQSFSLGDASVTFAKRSSSATDSSVYQLKSTYYGQRFLGLMRTNKGGPRVLNQT